MVDIALPAQLQAPPETGALTMWVIYDHPTDYPKGYVLRSHYVLMDATQRVSEIAWYASTPDELRAILPPGVGTNLGRRADDDPAILEVWV